MYISRISDDKREQRTIEHLQETAKYASSLAAKAHVPVTAHLAALLHDMGKFSTAFVEYLHENDKSKRGTIIHSTQGAKYIFNAWHSSQPLIAEIISIIVSGHHGGLMDAISPDGELPLIKRLTNTEKELFYNEVICAFHKENVLTESLDQMLTICNQELASFMQTCKEKGLNKAFMVHMLTKFLFSCLVDTDRYNAYCFETNTVAENAQSIPLWDDLGGKLEKNLAEKPLITEIDQIRKDISEKCLCAAKLPQGVYKLEVPTGGGKTLSSLRFAINHAKKYNMERIIYIIPYLSVLEQTAQNIREALNIPINDDTILEHHSNFIIPEDEDKANEIRLLTSRWNADIVITTMVQFMESIFSEKCGKLRKMHNMTNAVLIFDEVQSLPVKCVHLFNEAVNFLSAFGGSTILLCSATQPLLDRVDRPIKMSKKPELIDNTETAFRKLKRTRIKNELIKGGYSLEHLCDFVLEKTNATGNCLVVLNTKADASKLYDTIKRHIEKHSHPIKLVHLSTMMCPAHRLDVIRELKDDLRKKMRVICISTQLIEAGVDISFGCVVRANAGLDSIAQAAGRCNRNGEEPNGRDVYIVNLAQENLSKLPDIKFGSDITARIFDESGEESNEVLLSSGIMERYYDEYFYKRKDQMDYLLKNDGTMYDLLSKNTKGCGAYKNKGDRTMPALRQAYQTAGQQFCVIEQLTTDILVPYGRGAELAEKYKTAGLVDKHKILREMGRYSVALYQYDLNRLLDEKNALKMIDDGVLVLDDRYYDQHLGVVFSGKNEFLYVGGV